MKIVRNYFPRNHSIVGDGFSLYTNVNIVVKTQFVLGYITVNLITSSGKAENGINGEYKIEKG